jgi:hypothetical protein
VPLAPRFTSIPWDANFTYEVGNLVYSRQSGECYKSLANGNIGQDPTFIASNLTAQTLQEAVAGSPEIPPTNEKWSIRIDPPTWYGDTAEITYQIKLKDSANVEHAFSYVKTTGTMVTLDALLDALIAAAVGSTDTFINSATWAKDTANKLILVEKAELFSTAASSASVTGGSPFLESGYATLPGTRLTAYYAGSSEVLPLEQVSLLTLPSTLLPGAKYEVTLRDSSGQPHTVTYYSAVTDGANQILDGLVAAFAAAAGTDSFLAGVLVVVDYAGRRLTLSAANGFSLSGTSVAQGNPWWEEVLFPYALVEPVVRGAYSDGLRMGGQSDKAVTEEQAAVQEEADRAQKALSNAYDVLTDQQRAAPRYRTRAPAATPGGSK